MDRALALSSPTKLTSSASFSPSIRISLRLKIHQAQAKNFCRVLDIRVAKHMIIPDRNIQGNLEPPETVLQCSGFHWFTAAGQDIVFWFRAQRTKQRKHFCRQRQIPKGAFTFGRLKDQFRAPSVIDAVGRAPDMQQTAVKIYIRPTKSADLSQPDAGIQT